MRLTASVICYTGRQLGLIQVLKSIAAQEYPDSWEFVLVDGLWYEREEVVAELWIRLGNPAPLIHVPPLKPIGRDFYCRWDIPLYMNTGWAYARGEVVVQLEDHMTCSPTWLKRHSDFVKNHPNLVTIGDVVTENTNCNHYQRDSVQAMLEKWLADTALQASFDDPTRLSCVNAQAYGYWLSGNTGLWLEHVIKAGPFPETSTHNPESVTAPVLFAYGLSMWPLEGVKAQHWSHSHPMLHHTVYCKEASNVGLCFPVKEVDVPIEMRDLRSERERLNRWVP